MVKEDFTKGQTVWLFLTPHAFEYRKGMTVEERITTGTVVSVGRKYITVNLGNWEEKFEIGNDFIHVCECGSVRYILHTSKEDALIYGEQEELQQYILRRFGWVIVNQMSLEDLKTVKNIMEKYK